MSVTDKLVSEVQTSILPTMMAGDLVNLGIKLAMEINSDSSLTTTQKVEAVSQALVKGLALEKDKMSPELYTHLVLVAESAVPSSLTAVIDACNGKINLKEVSVKTWLSWFSCVTQRAVSVLASQGVISKEQADAATKAAEGSAVADLVSKAAGALEKVEAVAVAQGVISKEQAAQLTSVLDKVEKDLAPAAVAVAPEAAVAVAVAAEPETAPLDLSGVVVAVDPPQADLSANQVSVDAPPS